MNLQPVPAIVNEAKLPEPIHEETDPRSGGANHLCERLLTDLGDYSLRNAFLAEASKQQQNPGKSLFAGIEELVNQIFFVADVPPQQIFTQNPPPGGVAWSGWQPLLGDIQTLEAPAAALGYVFVVSGGRLSVQLLDQGSDKLKKPY